MKNAGFFRTDHHLATPALAHSARQVDICKEARFSDPAPLSIEYDLAM